jgi:hypothetical protein
MEALAEIISDFFNSIGQTRSFGDVGSMSGLPPKADFPILELLPPPALGERTAIAASRVGLRPGGASPASELLDLSVLSPSGQSMEPASWISSASATPSLLPRCVLGQLVGQFRAGVDLSARAYSTALCSHIPGGMEIVMSRARVVFIVLISALALSTAALLRSWSQSRAKSSGPQARLGA